MLTAIVLALLLDFDVSMEPKVYFGGKLESAELTIEYWGVEYSGVDKGGNIHRIRESVEIREAPYGPNRAILIAGQQLYARVAEGDEQVIGFLEAISTGEIILNGV